MKALRSYAVGGPETLTLDEIDVPSPGKGQVLVAVKACAINYPDGLIVRELYQFKPERPFSPGGEIAGTIEAAGFGQLQLWRERHAIYYPDLKTLLRAVKAIGAQNVGDGGRNSMMGRAAWQQVEAAYERFRTAEGLPASYDVILACARK